MTYSKQQLEDIKDVFLKNVGKVIKKYRDKKNMTQKELGKKIGVTHPSIARYEAGTSDMGIANMAYLSVILDFPLKEYVEEHAKGFLPGDKRKPMDAVLRDLIRKSEQSKKDIPEKIDERPPRPSVVYDRANYAWMLKPGISRHEKIENDIKARREYIEQNRNFNVEEEGKFFTEHCNNTDQDKEKLLSLIHEIASSEDYSSDDVRPLIKAAVNFVTNDRDRSTEKRLKAYKKYLECQEKMRLLDGKYHQLFG